MLHEQWKEQTFAARAATNYHRTEGVRTKLPSDEGQLSTILSEEPAASNTHFIKSP